MFTMFIAGMMIAMLVFVGFMLVTIDDDDDDNFRDGPNYLAACG